MKMKLAEIEMTAQNLARVAGKKLPHKLAYAIGKNLMALQPEQKLIDERRVEIAKTYADKDESGVAKVENNEFVLSEEGMKNFREEFVEFLNTETDVEIYMVPEDLLEQLENERFDVLTPAELLALYFMIEKQEEKADGK